MSLIEFAVERQTHPVDVIEHVAALEDWCFERAEDDEITVAVTGRWAEYHVSFSWMESVEALHLACTFDIRVPEPRRAEVIRLLALVNEQMWIGHFDLWSNEGSVLFRHAMVLSGGADPSARQIGALLTGAVEACDRYYQAFQFVVWAGRPAQEALEGAMFETVGVA
jgi:hypothetical protein